MIVQATRISRKGGVQHLSNHLLDKTGENDRIEILAGDRAALHDAQALAEAKGCRYSIRHLSISPEHGMTPTQLSEFIQAIDAEFRVGPDRPRLVVRHVKKGRSHFHFAIAEVDPATFKVLDCRNDFRRLEDLARSYEADHGENVQPTRAERKADRVEGFSDVARKCAERVSSGFDRTKLKTAFASGAATFLSEMKTQGLRVEDGSKGAILVTADGTFVAAACRAVGVKRGEFQKTIEGELQNEQLIGSQPPALSHAGNGGTQHHPAPAASGTARNPGGARPGRSTHGIIETPARHAAPDRGSSQKPHRQDRSFAASLICRQARERLFLHRLGKLDLDDLLRRARELAEWIGSCFEPETIRITRQIAEARQKRKSFPPADPVNHSVPTYHYGRRTTP